MSGVKNLIQRLKSSEDTKDIYSTATKKPPNSEEDFGEKTILKPKTKMIKSIDSAFKTPITKFIASEKISQDELVVKVRKNTQTSSWFNQSFVFFR